ncbi:MAG: 2-amino-4-hydroxy-6-hydroxymethyldihydropteridine diphosphokinase [Candidatus Edwardsbacteria bacterium]
MKKIAYLSLGANLGDRLNNIRSALAALEKVPGIKISKISSIYETKPWGVKNQPDFLNTVAEIETELSPEELLIVFQRIETHLNRHRSTKWGPRTIDLDLLFYADEVINEKELKIPHPEIPRRAFVLAPLSEIAPDLIHPTLQKNICELFHSLNNSEMKTFKKLGGK